MTNDGGPAFPTGPNKLPGYSSQGMALRDYFAAKALVGMLADPEVNAAESQFAAAAYRLADAMLAEREKGK